MPLFIMLCKAGIDNNAHIPMYGQIYSSQMVPAAIFLLVSFLLCAGNVQTKAMALDPKTVCYDEALVNPKRDVSLWKKCFCLILAAEVMQSLVPKKQVCLVAGQRCRFKYQVHLGMGSSWL